METIITASICLWRYIDYKAGKERYFMQVITAEAYKHYYVELTKLQALKISNANNLDIEDRNNVPEFHAK
jgi:hypothetical protein